MVMRRAQVQVESGLIVIDLVEDEAPAILRLDQHVEAPAAELLLDRGLRIGEDELAETLGEARPTTNSTRSTSGILGLRRNLHQARNRLQMLVHGGGRGIRIIRRHGLQDPAMRSEGRFLGPRRPQRDRPLAREPFDECVMDSCEDRVAGGLCQHVVEGDIGALEARDVAARGRIRLERVPQPLDVVTVGARSPRDGRPRPRIVPAPPGNAPARPCPRGNGARRPRVRSADFPASAS